MYFYKSLNHELLKVVGPRDLRLEIQQKKR